MEESLGMFSEQVLKGKKILITGGGTGIGKSLGSRFLELGAEIVICGRREEVLKGTVGEWMANGGKASYLVCDIRVPDKVEAMFEQIWKDRPLDGLVNNAVTNTTGNGTGPYQAGVSDQGSQDVIQDNFICGPGYPASDTGGLFAIDVTATNGPIVKNHTICSAAPKPF